VTSSRDDPTGDPVDEDLERTEFAWDRSALAMAAVALVLLKQILPTERTHPVVGWIVLALAAATGLVGLGYRRHRRQHPRPSRLALKLVSAATAVIGVTAFFVSLVAPTAR
jgi:uncharacterized membrane protein YidH (DUF202 family)